MRRIRSSSTGGFNGGSAVTLRATSTNGGIVVGEVAVEQTGERVVTPAFFPTGDESICLQRGQHSLRDDPERPWLGRRRYPRDVGANGVPARDGASSGASRSACLGAEHSDGVPRRLSLTAAQKTMRPVWKNVRDGASAGPSIWRADIRLIRRLPEVAGIRRSVSLRSGKRYFLVGPDPRHS